MAFLDYVNAKVGTYNERRFSNGNIYPVTAQPFGMTHFTVQTNGSAGSWFYSPVDHTFEGFRLTHQPSPWVGDYGHMLFLPFSGTLYAEGNRWSSFRPEEAVIRPDKLEVYLQRYRIRAALTPTVRGCVLRMSNEAGADTALAVLPFVDSAFRVEGNTLTGYTDAQSIWGFARIREYFYAEFSETPTEVLSLERGGVAVRFASANTTVKIATSFVSEEQARRNFEQELSTKSYDEVEKETQSVWEGYLGRIEVSDENEEKRRMFYSCLYRALLYPRVFHEYDEAGNPVHFNADTNRVEKGVFYTDNGFWDTFRTVFPLYSIIAPELAHDMVEGFVNYSDETGWLPKWLSPGDIGLMPGTLVEAIIADACVKGIVTGELRERAYRAMLRNAYEKEEGRHGRTGALEYIQYGYVPNDFREGVNHTCDSAYGDFCISEVARLVGDTERAEKLAARSKNYRNLFDHKTNFFRGRNREGAFKEPFDPYSWGGDNCECSSWQNSFPAMYDVEGLTALYGGKAKLLEKLDAVFAAPPHYAVGWYAQEIHEMSEMACVDFGQCAISNQPSFHIPWLYAALGEREKTEYWVEKLANEAFFCTNDGFPGDEDNGTMAAWYVFACLGFYPLCPGKAEYVTAKPLFARILVNGKPLTKFEGRVALHSEITTCIRKK